ncbi:aldo/keto reductase [Octadecabacter antarcticus 307]|uniref:Aldo/keto reductase n=1 Tax=Octadecabacter antarcticus 307 TaxID=391626 RepID=M9RD35_9RHOB|nr:aldo/keto reductase [Octadecabacter antarcticus]AGI69673.1 aldo/keto reductase [Octadecabacter antarcticus 307]
MTLSTQSGAMLTPAAYGTMQWGGTADIGAARTMFDACLDAGIRHFDTAFLYTDGRSEEFLGDIAGNLDDVFVATKAAYNQPATTANIHASFDVSRKRLKRDCIDLLYMHRFDDTTPLDDTFEALAALQTSGAIRFIGVSNYAAWQVMKAQGVAAKFGTKIDVIQPMMNLVKRQVEAEILPMTRDQGIQVCAYSPLGAGLLTRKYAAGGDRRLAKNARYATRYGPRWMHEAAHGLAQIAADLDVDAATLAVAWLRHHAPDVHPILSARSVAQLTPSLGGLTFEMDDATYAAITALSPAPPPATDRIEEA